VRAERKRRGWGRKELAAKALVSSMTIGNIENGYPCLPITAAAIERAFRENPPTLDGLIQKVSA
jgi:DNA-binding XRE family transcriptional regulator